MKRSWDTIPKYNRYVYIDKRSEYIIHLSNGTIKYDYDKFDSWGDAVLQEYHDFGADSAKKAMDCAISNHQDAIREWNKWIKLGFIKEDDYWEE